MASGEWKMENGVRMSTNANTANSANIVEKYLHRKMLKTHGFPSIDKKSDKEEITNGKKYSHHYLYKQQC